MPPAFSFHLTSPSTPEFYTSFHSISHLFYNRMSQVPSQQAPHFAASRNDTFAPQASPLSQQKLPPAPLHQDSLYMRRYKQKEKPEDESEELAKQNRVLDASKNLDNPFNDKAETDLKSELLRSFLRIQQDREEPVDKFVKVAWTYKGRFPYDRRLKEIMKQPGKFLQKLTSEQLQKLISSSEGHLEMEKASESNLMEFWRNLIQLGEAKLQKLARKSEELGYEHEHKIAQVISKPLQELVKLEKQIILILKSQSFGANHEYWRHVQSRLRVKMSEERLLEFYEEFRKQNANRIDEEEDVIGQEVDEEPTSPTLVPYSSVNPKLIVKEEEEKEKRVKLAQKIFTEEFQKGRERLEVNLSLPHNHGLLSTQIITEQTSTYDQITKEIIEFEKYKRMEEDEEEFNDWVPCETEGRFRDRKPIYLNRVRVAREANKYGCVHRYTEDNPPPKTVQGYKFNIFYPDLYDKQKTPQYYLSTTDDPNYCIITFKASPPYKDIAFKILRREWEFTQKSGFESIFARGILHLYFNFKKPRFRI